MEEDITPDLAILETRLEDMINRVQNNSRILQKFQAFQLRLLGLSSLPDIIEHILTESKAFFALDEVSLALVDAEGKIAAQLSEYHYVYREKTDLILLADSTFLSDELSAGPYIGTYDEKKHQTFFPTTKKPLPTIAMLPLHRRGQYLGSLNLGIDKSERLIDSMSMGFLDQLVALIGLSLENNAHYDAVKQFKITEALANANNRRFIEQRLIEELERNQRVINHISCLLIGIDFPKGKNPNMIEQMEAHVMKSVADILKQQFRVSDVFSYYEAKKFAALLVNTSESVIATINKRIRAAIGAQQVKFSGQVIPVSIAIGYASQQITAESAANHQELAIQLISTADNNLATNKQTEQTQIRKTIPHPSTIKSANA